MDIKTLLNEGLNMDKRGRINTKGSLKEAFEAGQPELDPEMTAGSSPIDIEWLRAKVEKMARASAEADATKLMSYARMAVREHYRTVGVDLEANVKAHDLTDSDDILEGSDEFFEIIEILSNIYLEEFQENWVMPFLNM